MNFTIEMFLKTLLPLLISYSFDKNLHGVPCRLFVQARRAGDSGEANLYFEESLHDPREAFICQRRKMKVDYTYRHNKTRRKNGHYH